MKWVQNTILTIFLLSVVQLRAQEVWNIVDLGISDNLVDIYFLNNQDGWIIGSAGTFISTTNGGNDWNIDTIPYQGLKKIQFISEETGWIIGNDSLVLKTTDGGTSWLEQKVNLGFLGDIHFFNDQVGLICGGSEGPPYGKILRTTDGGKVWEKYTLSDYSLALTTFCFIDSLNGWMTGNADLFKTSDTGITWEKISGFGDEVLDIYFLDPMNGIACGWYHHGPGDTDGEIYKTTDGGFSWKTVYEDYSAAFSSIAYHENSNSLYCVSYTDGVGKIFKSSDKGNSWLHIECPTSQLLNYVTFSGDKGWIVGRKGTLLTTSMISSVDETDMISAFHLFSNYPNPFNPSTKIKYVIPKSSFVNLTVYDVLGREVATLVNEERRSGNYEVKFDGTGLSSGIYFYVLNTGDKRLTRKMCLIK